MGRIAIIAAVAENRVIGIDNVLPWRLPDDLKHFRRLTTGHHVLMGRKNYESIGGPLADRTNLVLTRNSGYSAPGCRVVTSIEQALEIARDDPETFVIGGADVYAQTLDRADRMYLTLVHAVVEGDTLFPAFEANQWAELERDDHDADARHAHAYSLVTLERTTRHRSGELARCKILPEVEK